MRGLTFKAWGKLAGFRPLASVSGGPSGGAAAVFSEVRDAIDAALIACREPDEDGPRVAVISSSLRGSFIYSREEAERRIRLSFPELSKCDVARAVRHLENKTKLLSLSRSDVKQRNWVHGWKE